MAKYLHIGAALLLSCFLFIDSATAQTRSMASKNVTLQFPAEREILGRELSAEAQRCYEYMNRALDGGLARNVVITLDWSSPESSWNFRTGRAVIGMNQPEALKDPRQFLHHSLPVSIARLGLITLSQGGQREDTEFLFAGMSEILAHEYNHSSRTLEAAWPLAHLMELTGELGFARQRVWSEFAKGHHDHYIAAPGITFLLTRREVDRSSPVKFFAALRRNSLLKALNLAFKAPAADLESAWLAKVRAYVIPEEITVPSDGAPQILKVVAETDAGQSRRLRIDYRDPKNDVYAENVFARDLRTQKVIQADAAPPTTATDAVLPEHPFFTVTLPGAQTAGTHSYQIIMIDEAGNLRQNTATCDIK